ncbi:ubiquitin conjugating enzyme e2 [Aspergillus sp. HF37]|nr:ubiquitin conjugating enzyme e2 [Aspergillus sp. HF37]
MAPNLRRLAADQAALHDSHLPPYYLFPRENDLSASADDLTQLTVLLAGPQGTPYAQGLWRIHLKMPDDYPRSPPKASFRTRIWHPNVDESSGSVCVDTLKRDWESRLTLRDVLVTISCLLIYPNPDSALNSTAGALLQEDYDAFSRQAKIMSSIHAPVSDDLSSAAYEAKLRGEDAGSVIQEKSHTSLPLSQKDTTATNMKAHSLRMKKKPAQTAEPGLNPEPEQQPVEQQLGNITQDLSFSSDGEDTDNDENDNNLATATKENDPSLFPSPVKLAPPSPRKNAHGKRPLSVLSLSPDPSAAMEPDHHHLHLHHATDTDTMTASEQNVAANDPPERHDSSPNRKSPKLSSSSSAAISKGARDVRIFEDDAPDPALHLQPSTSAGKENHVPSASAVKEGHAAPATQSGSQVPRNLVGKVPSSSSSSKRKPRIGIRRL